ncbi:hypothetical protein [Natronobiforma cellulositropha]|uniref:hypothetical protein n=1 Tax=Natronobiforma cellulositropha TaxID=1679076 RepID=UPI0021D5D851|nr:hypothetical protein [Natronobiforma cellulositropha]
MSTLRTLAVLSIVAGAVLLAGPAFGFASFAADRGVILGVADNAEATVAIEPHDVVVDDTDTAVATITNNADVALTLETTADVGEGLTVTSGFDGTLEPGEMATIALGCDASSGQGPVGVDLTVSASGPGVSLTGIAESFTVERDCAGPGGGFGLVYISDVSGFVAPSEERQEIRFRFDEQIQTWDTVEIDLSEARDNGVNYDGVFGDGGDIVIEQGAGAVWTSGDSIVYQVTDADDLTQDIVLSLGSYATDGNSEPFDVTFTRTDTGESVVTQFEIDGDDGADAAFLDAWAADLSSTDGRQSFGFTPGAKVASWDEVRIDLGGPLGEDVAYGWDARLEEGPRSDDSVWRSGETLVYQSSPADRAGEAVVVSLDVDATNADPGTYTVTFTRTDTGDQETVTFTLE